MILRHSFLIILSCMSIVFQKTYGNNIPGIPGVDYPNFSEIPPTSFHCPESKLGRFYPDFETRCQVFHYCEDGNRETFICPIGSIFNPHIKSCDRWFNSECYAAHQNDEERGYDRQTDYEVESNGGVASLFKPSSSVYDKMASLFEGRSSGAYGQYKIDNGPRVNQNVQYSEYGSSGVDPMGENAESRREVSETSRGDTHLGLKQSEGLKNGMPFPYGLSDRNAEGWDSDVSDDSASLKTSFQDGANLKTRGQAHSEQNINREKKNDGAVRKHTSESVRDDGYKAVGSYSDHSYQSSKGLGVMHNKNPTIYNYHTQSNQHNRNEEDDSIFYDEVNDAQGDSYASFMDFDDYEDSIVNSDQSMDLQKRISEYRRRPRPKPVVSLVESDLEIVTLSPPRQKRHRIPLLQKNGVSSVTEPMTTTTELSADAQHKSEKTEASSAASATKSTSDDLTREDENLMMSDDFQPERKGNERALEDWFTEESSGEAEDFLPSEDFHESLDLNKNEKESDEAESIVERLHNMMKPSLFYVDSSSDSSGKENGSNIDRSTDKSDEQNEKNYGKTHDYKNEELDMDHKVLTEKYSLDDAEIEDSSEVSKSNQYGDNFYNEKHQYENKNEGTEDFGELFQTVVDGEIKSLIRIGEEIIDPTEYYPDWTDDSGNEREDETFYDRVDKASEKYLVENFDGYQSEESQDLNSFLDQNMKTSEGYFTDNESGNSSPDFAADSAETVSEEVTFIPSADYEFPTTEYYDTINTDGTYMYDGSRDSETLDSFYRGDDVRYIDNPSEHGGTNEDIVISSDDASLSDKVYYYTTDMDPELVTDQPDMEMAATAMIDNEYSADTGVEGDSEYVYEVSPSDDSDTEEEFKEEYFTTHSSVSDVGTQFVTDQPNFGISSTAMADEESYLSDSSIQEDSDKEFEDQYFHTDSYDDSVLGTRFVTNEPDIEMSTIAMLDGEQYSKDRAVQGESRTELDMSNSDGSYSDMELFQDYLQTDSELKADFEKEKERNTEADKVNKVSKESNQDERKLELDGTFSSVFDNAGTSHISKTMDSKFDKSISSNIHHKKSGTAQKSKSRETSLDSQDVQHVHDFDFDSVEDTGMEIENESFKEDSQSSISGDSRLKFQSSCSTCELPFSSEKRHRSFSSSRLEMMEESNQTGRTGKLVEGSKLAKLASFVKKMVAAKKKAKLNIVKKILPSSEWNTEV